MKYCGNKSRTFLVLGSTPTVTSLLISTYFTIPPSFLSFLPSRRYHLQYAPRCIRKWFQPPVSHRCSIIFIEIPRSNRPSFMSFTQPGKLKIWRQVRSAALVSLLRMFQWATAMAMLQVRTQATRRAVAGLRAMLLRGDQGLAALLQGRVMIEGTFDAFISLTALTFLTLVDVAIHKPLTPAIICMFLV